MARQFSRTERKPPAPLDRERLEALALRYVGRYATTRAKLAAYLVRKLRERGWEGEGEAPVATLVERLVELRYVDDRAFAEARGAALGRRGYGARRIGEALRHAGVNEEDGATARESATTGKLAAALALARRKRLGPFAATAPDPEAIRRAIGQLVRAGHDFAMARRIAAAQPGEKLEETW